MSDDVNKDIRQLVRTVLGMPEDSVRKANQDGMPSGGQGDAYATVFISEYAREGWDALEQKDEDAPSLNVEETVHGQRNITASVQFFRAGALTRARRLELVLNFSSSLELMQDLGLGLVDVSSVTDLTGVVDTYFEERARIVLRFHVSAVETVSVPTYGKFPISVTTPAQSANFEVISP